MNLSGSHLPLASPPGTTQGLLHPAGLAALAESGLGAFLAMLDGIAVNAVEMSESGEWPAVSHPAAVAGRGPVKGTSSTKDLLKGLKEDLNQSLNLEAETRQTIAPLASLATVLPPVIPPREPVGTLAPQAGANSTADELTPGGAPVDVPATDPAATTYDSAPLPALAPIVFGLVLTPKPPDAPSQPVAVRADGGAPFKPDPPTGSSRHATSSAEENSAGNSGTPTASTLEPDLEVPSPSHSTEQSAAPLRETLFLDECTMPGTPEPVTAGPIALPNTVESLPRLTMVRGAVSPDRTWPISSHATSRSSLPLPPPMPASDQNGEASHEAASVPIVQDSEFQPQAVPTAVLTAEDGSPDPTPAPAANSAPVPERSGVEEPAPSEPARPSSSRPAAAPRVPAQLVQPPSDKAMPTIPRSAEQPSPEKVERALPVPARGASPDARVLSQPLPSETTGAQPARSETEQPELAPVRSVLREPEVSVSVPTQPARQISLRLSGSDAPNVDVQLRERGGKVQVAVRTADPQLGRDLQSDLGGLVSRLESRGFKTETWAPSSTHTGSATKAAPSAGNQGQAGHSGSGGNQQPRHWQKGSNPRRPPRRTGAFEETFAAEARKESTRRES